ncbi:hypothetical protein [Streptomyces sviceus]|uniref:hypothetical protein n=1 Tax=Streptomyces sviceus TaxID=285530 RepID=UPI0036B9E216
MRRDALHGELRVELPEHFGQFVVVSDLAGCLSILLGERARRRLVRSVLSLAVLGAGYYGFHLQYPAAKTARACGGMLAVDPVLDLTGRSKLSLLGLGFHVSSKQFDVSSDVTEPPGLATTCNVDGVVVSIETASGAHNAYGVYTFQRDQDALPVPLGTGWQGFMVTEEQEATASVLLSCRNWTPEEGSGILVAAESPYEGEVTQAVRLELARAVTGAAQRAAEKTGCSTEAGDTSRLTAPAAAARSVSASDATGTCKGMTSAATVTETAAGTSPAEECVLVGGLQLAAAYGPFSDASQAVVNGKYGGHATPSGTDTYTVWTSSTCQGASGVGYYHASPIEGSDREFTSDPLTKEEQADLEHFAERSATRHGCRKPAALPGQARP